MPLMSEEPMQEITTTKREKIKGHYRSVTRDVRTGQIVTSEKWSPPRSPCLLCYRLDIGRAYQEDPEEYKNPRTCYGNCSEYKHSRYKPSYPNCRNPAIATNPAGWVKWAKNKQRGLNAYVEALDELLSSNTHEKRSQE